MEVYNEKKKLNVTTYGSSYANYETKEKMQIDYSNKNLALKIMPVDDNFRGIEAKAGDIYFQSATASIFVDELKEAKAAFQKGEAFNSMVTCGVQTNNGIQITDGSNIGRPYGMYIVIYKDIQANKKTDKFWIYTVKGAFVVKNYDTKTGQGEMINKPFRELKDIIINFDEFIKASNRAAAHAVRDADKYSKSSLMQAVNISKSSGTNIFGDKEKSGKKSGGSIFSDDEDSFSYDSADLNDVLTMSYH